MTAGTDEKRSREVSKFVFPYYDLDVSIEVAKALHDKAGGKASLAQLASYIGHKDEFSGAYRSKLWGCQLFGLLNLSGNVITITPLGEYLASAREGIQRDRRLAEAFLNVPLFREVYRKYEHSTLPGTREGLKRALQDTFGVSSKLVSLAVKSLERSAEQAGFRRNGINRLIHPVPEGLIEKESVEDTSEVEGASEETRQPVGEVVSIQPKNVHPAIMGFLQELPTKEKPWSSQKKQTWIQAFDAMINALYPSAEDQ